jgi:hypothetical protein
MNHLEQLISEWLEIQDYIVKKNTKVGRLEAWRLGRGVGHCGIPSNHGAAPAH